MKLLLIDNYDSFTYNLLHLFSQIDDVEVVVARNDMVRMDDIENKKYEGVIIGPGPGSPISEEYFGNNMKIIKVHGGQGLPILGVCLGFQGIAIAYGGSLKQAKLPQHGKTSKITIHDNNDLLKDIPQKTEVMRYHSLMIDTEKPFPDDLFITAEVDEQTYTVRANGREIMAIKHKILPVYGVQFHPESFATEMGDKIAKNFVEIVKALK
jgi:anthranilate synthase component II